MKAKPRVHSVDTFVHAYKLEHPEEVVLSTKNTLCLSSSRDIGGQANRPPESCSYSQEE